MGQRQVSGIPTRWTTALMQNPHESPKTADKKPPPDAPSVHAARDLPRFFACYFGAFILATLLWHLSAFTRRFDFLELPMAALCFPLAGFIDPHDGMVNDRDTFFFAIAFWGAVIPLALCLTPKRISPLLTALAIIVICSSASVAYVILRALTSGPVY
jgi:hypothetical protein